ncbi:hypothetical protein GGI35DRAFT_462653 [Trichoderma velutinum]
MRTPPPPLKNLRKFWAAGQASLICQCSYNASGPMLLFRTFCGCKRDSTRRFFDYCFSYLFKVSRNCKHPAVSRTEALKSPQQLPTSAMFTVLFEVHPSLEKKALYLDIGKALRPELLQIDGFIDNIRYGSLTKPGWILSLSTWRDEKSLVRWRTQGRHHGAQENGRKEVFLDYRLRICEITTDTHIPEGYGIQDQRLDVTRAGDAEAVVLVSMNKTGLQNPNPGEVLDYFRLESNNIKDLVSWDVFDALLDPGDAIVYLSFTTANAASEFLKECGAQKEFRYRGARVIRDYGMYNRHEAPQYYPDVERRE